MIAPDEKRSISVVPAENETGRVEYKRQVHSSSAARLRSLATQMSYRLDEGNGCCMYRIGVEDDGCHSLMSYEEIAESARVLECIARSLNSVVIERKMIQGEVKQDDNGKLALDDSGNVVMVNESPVFADKFDGIDKPNGVDPEASNGNEPQLRKEPGFFTRAELTIQRVETHLLDPSPISVAALAESSASGDSQSTVKAVSSHPNGNSPRTKEEGSTISETLARNLRVAVVGNVDAGKSTLIGTLTTSSLDDGRGKSRTSIMKHRHEIESGRTSTATTHLMGFRSTGEPITGKDQVRANKRKTEDEIARESHRIITLMDLAGHEKYLKTTIHGVSSGIFGIPVIVIFTKIDGCPEHAFKTSKQEVSKLLRSPEVGKRPFAIRNEQDVSTCMGKLHTLAPMIETSCVTGKGIDLLQKMLFSLPKRRRHENKANRPFEFLVEDIFNVPGVGAVVSGFVNAGDLTVGANCHVYVGPTDDGSFMKTVAKSAHIARINTAHITSGQSACIAFALSKDLRKKLRRGMVVLKDSPSSTREFDAEICVLKGEGTTIRRSYQAYVHILNVRQSAFARNIEIVNHNAVGLPPSHSAARDDEDNSGIVLRPGSRAKVRLSLLNVRNTFDRECACFFAMVASVE